MRTNRTGRRPALGVVVGLLMIGAAACGDDSSAPRDTSPQADPSGTTYALANAYGVDVPESSALLLAFGTDATVQVSGGCNTMSGPYEIANGTLVVQSLGGTEMACEPELMKFDREIAAFIGGSPSITLVGDVMTLARESVTLSLRAVTPEADSPLEGTLWTVTGTVQGDGTQSLDTEPATLQMDGGTAEVFAGCNTGTATYTVEGDRITFGPLALTKMACDQPAMLLESVVTKVLTGTLQYDIEGTKLSLFQGSDGLTLADQAQYK
jgi:heat shock protein HslJ